MKTNTKTNNKVVKLRLVKSPKQKVRAGTSYAYFKESLEKAIKEFNPSEDPSFLVQGFALVVIGNGGNSFYTKYDTRRDFPTRLLPELVKQTLTKIINDSTTPI